MSSNNNDDQPGSSHQSAWPSKKHSPRFLQPRTTTTSVIPTHPAGYPDQFFPDPVSYSNRHPSRRLLFESQMSKLISPGFLQIDDITMFSPLRKDAFCSITLADGAAVLFARKVTASHFKLPLYKRNPVIIQNGFSVKIKNFNGACVLTMKRNTLLKSNLANETDIMNVWLGNQVIPVGQIRKPALINEYKVMDEFNNPLYVIHKAESVSDPKDVKKRYKYMIHKVGELELIGQINCRGKKGIGPLANGEYPCSTEFQSDLTITEKSLVLGALFLIASRAYSGIEGDEEKIRQELDTEQPTTALLCRVDSNANVVTFSASSKEV